MAKRVGVPASSWARMETGERWPSSIAVNGLKKLLGIPLNQPLNQEGELPIVNTQSLSEADRRYLEAKWWLEKHKLGRTIEKMEARRQKAIDMRHVQAEELHTIHTELIHAEKVIELLSTQESTSKLVAHQQEVLDDLSKKKKRAENGIMFLSNAQIKVLETEIEWLKKRMAFLADKIDSLSAT